MPFRQVLRELSDDEMINVDESRQLGIVAVAFAHMIEHCLISGMPDCTPDLNFSWEPIFCPSINLFMLVMLLGYVDHKTFRFGPIKYFEVFHSTTLHINIILREKQYYKVLITKSIDYGLLNPAHCFVAGIPLRNLQFVNDITIMNI